MWPALWEVLWLPVSCWLSCTNRKAHKTKKSTVETVDFFFSVFLYSAQRT